MIKPDYYNKYMVTSGSLNVYPLDYFDQYHFMLGNVLKYLLRYQDKDGKADLEKALTYLEQSENKEMLESDYNLGFEYLLAKNQLGGILLSSTNLPSRFINLQDLYENSSYEERKEKFYEPLKTLIKQEIERLEKESVESKKTDKKEVEDICKKFLNMLKEFFTIKDLGEFQLVSMYFKSSAVSLVEDYLKDYMKDYEDPEVEKKAKQGLTNILKAFMCSIKHLLLALDKLEDTAKPCVNNCASIFPYQPLLVVGTLDHVCIDELCGAICALIENLEDTLQSSSEIWQILNKYHDLFALETMDSYVPLEQK